MGSRLMHLIASSLAVRNKRDFLIGSIAPDAALIQHAYNESIFSTTKDVGPRTG